MIKRGQIRVAKSSRVVPTDSCRTLVRLVNGPSGELPAITKQERILKILKDASEWLPSEQFLPVGNKTFASLKGCIQILRQKSHNMGTRTIHEDGETTTFYRLISGASTRCGISGSRAKGQRSCLNASITTMTPEQAQQLIETSNAGGLNRLKKAKVNRFAGEMSKGKWALNGESIIISVTGRILDGHHRLKACILSKQSFETVLVTDAPDDTSTASILASAARLRTHCTSPGTALPWGKPGRWAKEWAGPSIQQSMAIHSIRHHPPIGLASG